MAFDPTNAVPEEDDLQVARPKRTFDPSSAVEDPDAEQGIAGSLWQGTKSMGRAIGATANTYAGNEQGVVAKAKAQQEAPKDYRLERFYRDIEDGAKANGEDAGVLDAIGNVGSAVVDNPAGAGLAVLEQLPNAVPTLGGGWAGAKAGGAAGAALGSAVPGIGTAVGGTVGGILGGLAGMFLGNAAIETGHKAMGLADDGQFTPEEQSQAKREGAIKGGVITGVDALTLGAGRAVSGAMGRTASSALEAATRKALMDNGVDVADQAAVLAARQNPTISAAVRSAQESALKATDTLKRRATEAGTLMSMETVGEGVGEYLGELAATGEGNINDAVLESLLSVGQSGAEAAWNMRGSRDQRGLWDPAAEADPAAGAAPGAPAAPAPSAGSAPDTVQPTPTPENPLPAPVPRPDPSNGPISSAASRLPSGPAPAPVLDTARLNQQLGIADVAAQPAATGQGIGDLPGASAPAAASPEEAALLDSIAQLDRRAGLEGGWSPALQSQRLRLGEQLDRLQRRQQAEREAARPRPQIGDLREEGVFVDGQGNAQPGRFDSRTQADYVQGGAGMERQTPRGEPAPLTGDLIRGNRQRDQFPRETRVVDGEIVGRGVHIPSDNRPRLEQDRTGRDRYLPDMRDEAMMVDGQGNAAPGRRPTRSQPDYVQGGRGMDRQTPQGEPAPLTGQLIRGNRQRDQLPRTTALFEGELAGRSLADMREEAVMVDSQGNAAPGRRPTRDRPDYVQGGRGMDQQTPRGEAYQITPAERRAMGANFKQRAAAERAIQKLPAPERYTAEQQGDRWAVKMLPAPSSALSAEPPRADEDMEAWAHRRAQEIVASGGRLILDGDQYVILRFNGAPEVAHVSKEAAESMDRDRARREEEEARQAGELEAERNRTRYAESRQRAEQERRTREAAERTRQREEATRQERERLARIPVDVDDTFDFQGKTYQVTRLPSGQDKGEARQVTVWRGGSITPNGSTVYQFTAEQFEKATGRTFAAPKPAAKAAPKKNPRRIVNRDRDSVVQAAIRLGGIKTEWRQDTTGDTKGNKGIPGVGYLWTDKTGTSVDDMASLLDQHGYVPAGEMGLDGGVSWLQEAIRDELAGIRTHYAPGSAMQEAEAARLEAERMAAVAEREPVSENDGSADELEAIVASWNEERGTDEERLAKAQAHAASLDAYFGDDNAENDQAGSPTSADQGNGASASDPDAGSRATGEGQRPTGGDQGPARGGEEGFQLEAETEASRRAREEREAEARKQADDQRRREEQRAQADAERDSFTLTGSSRPSDVGAAFGQNDMFMATRGQRQAEQTAAPAEPAALMDVVRFTPNADAGMVDAVAGTVIGVDRTSAGDYRIRILYQGEDFGGNDTIRVVPRDGSLEKLGTRNEDGGTEWLPGKNPDGDGSNSRFDRMIRIAADDAGSLRRPDVYRVLEQVQSPEALKALGEYIGTRRPDLAEEVGGASAELRQANGWIATERTEEQPTLEGIGPSDSLTRSLMAWPALEAVKGKGIKAEGLGLKRGGGQTDVRYRGAPVATIVGAPSKPKLLEALTGNAAAATEQILRAAEAHLGKALNLPAGARLAVDIKSEANFVRSIGSTNASLHIRSDSGLDGEIRLQFRTGEPRATLWLKDGNRNLLETSGANRASIVSATTLPELFDTIAETMNRAMPAAEQQQADAAPTEAVPEFPLSEAVSSYNGISHQGRSRAKSDRDSYEATIAAQVEEAQPLAETDAQRAALEQATANFRRDYLSRYRSLMNVRAGTYSGFVAGRAKLNAKQANSRNSALDKAMDRFFTWLKAQDGRLKKAVLAARSPEQQATAQRAEEEAQRAKDAKKAEAKRKDAEFMARLLTFKAGDDLKIGDAIVVRVNKSRDGYPTSIKYKNADGSQPWDDKIDLAIAMYRGDKDALRRDVDAARALLAERAEQAAEPAQKAPSIEGRNLGDGWVEFAEGSGTLDIPRTEMPQIRAEHRGAMVNFLNARGIAHEEETVPAASLKPTQAEFSRSKVRQAREYTGGNRSILVSREGHVLDGHHQWVASREKGEDVKVIRLDAPIRDLLDAAHAFPSSTTEQQGAPEQEAEKPEQEAAKPEQEASKPEQKPAKQPSKTPLLDEHADTMAAVREGKATPEQYKASFARLLDNADAIKAELNTLKKDDLFRMVGPYFRMHHKSDTKPKIVEAVYRVARDEYALGKSYGPTSYMLSAGGLKAHEANKLQALRELVEGQTAETLAEYAAQVAAERAEFDQKRAARKAAIENPQTLSDFRAAISYQMRQGKTEAEARLELTPEQRMRMDELEAESTREAREARKRAARSEVRTAGQTVGGEIVETRHTRDGYDLFVVQLAERVSRDDYGTMLAAAKRMGGWYSKFRGNGAVPGFQFKERTSAEAFLQLAAGDKAAAEAQVAQRRDAFEDDRSQSAVERLTEMADRLEERADESLNADRKTNTARRARQAASAEAAARADKALAKTMRNLAEAISNGTAKFLDAVRQKVQIEQLDNYVRVAKGNELRAKYPGYADQESHKGEAPSAQTADFAEFPSFTAYRSDLAALARQLLDVDGTKKIGQRLMSLADDVTDAYLEFAKANFHQVATFARQGGSIAQYANRDTAQAAIRRSGLTGKAIVLPLKRGENIIVLSPSEAMDRGIWKGDGDKRITLERDFGAELVSQIGRANGGRGKITVPWQFETANDRLNALRRMGIETPAEFRSALREYIRLRQQPAAPDRIKQMERAMVGRRNDGLDFFPTPAGTADAMIAAADLQPGMRVLEPSAGMGHIAERIREAGFEPDVVELSGERRELLTAKGFNIVGNDFLETKPREFFTYGDTFRAHDGTEGIMRGHPSGPWGGRVRLDDANGKTLGYYNRAELEPVRRNGSSENIAGLQVPRSDVERAEAAARGTARSYMGNALFFYDRGDMETAAMFVERAQRVSEDSTFYQASEELAERLRGAAAGQYDRILMNPPFSDRRDAEHIKHAFSLLKPGGRLVAIAGEGVFFGSDKKAQAFRDWLDEQGATVEKLPEGTFNDPSLPVTTGVNTRLLVIDKPATDTRYRLADEARGLPPFSAKALARKVKDATGLNVNVVKSEAELPAALRQQIERDGATGRVAGVYFQGAPYVVAANVRDTQHALSVVLHEVVGHGGVRAVLGARVDRIMGEIYRSMPAGVRRELEARYAGQLAGLTQAQAEGVLAEEYVAHLAETDPRHGFIGRLVALVRKWLRDTFGDRMAMKWTRGDIVQLLAEARRAVTPDDGGNGGARYRQQAAAVETETEALPVAEVGEEISGEDMTAFARALYKGQGTQSAFFRRWFGASKMKNKDGTPVAFYHRSFDPRERFDNTRLGGNTGTATAQFGHYFATRDVGNVERYGPLVEKFFIKMEKPKVVTMAQFEAMGEWTPEQARAWRERLQGQGHDGLWIQGLNWAVAFDGKSVKAVANRGTFDDSGLTRYALTDFVPAWLGGREPFQLTAKDARRQLKGRLADLKPSLLGTLPLMYLRDFAPKSMTALSEYLEQKRAMDADRNELHTKYDAIAQRWLKLRWSDRKAERRLADLMHAATLAGIDPSKPFGSRYSSDQRPEYDRLRAQFEALPEGHRAMFGEVRDAYRSQIGTLEKVIEDNIRKSAEYAIKRARRDRDAALEDARDELAGEDLEEAIETIEKRYQRRVTAAESGTSAKLLLLRQKFEGMRVDEPYFPLKRHGDYFVALRDGTKLVSFSMYEKAADMEAAAADLQRTYPGLEVKVGRQSVKQELQGAVDPAFVADIQELVATLPNSSEVADQLWQKYLETLPDYSMRKGFIHRKKVAGFDRDAMRSFASSMFHGSYQIARLKHSLEMNELVEQVEEQAKAAADPVDAMTIANELRKRHEWVMAPKGGKIAQHITSAAFVYQLGLTPAAALVNTSQTWMMGIPVLGTRFGSEAKAMAALGKASKDFVKGRGYIENELEGQELEAFKEFLRMGLIDKTQAHDLAGVGETGVEYNPIRHKVMGYISWAFHNAERYNREVTAMAAYRLARESGMGQEAAIKEAAELTWTVHFDYSSGNRARYLQNDTAKVLFVFRQHSVNMLSRLVIDLKDAMKGESPQVKKAAKRRLAGMFGMYAFFAGAMGIPGMTAVLALLDLLDDDDDPWSAEDKIKRTLNETLGEDITRVVLGGVPGTALDLSLTERLGMGSLWFWSPNRELEGQDAYYYWMEQMLGAAPAMVGNAFTGMKQIGEGHVWRGIETMMPKAIKDVMRSSRYATEGVQTMAGDALVDEVSTWNVIAQAMGFTPAHIAEQYDRNSALKNAEQKILTERRGLMNRYAMAMRAGDREARAAIRERIGDFNRRYPRVAITGNTLALSLRARAQRDRRTEGGLALDKRLQGLRAEL